MKPDSVAAWNELASVSIVNQNYADGLAALDQVHRLGKEIPGDFFLRAITLDKLKANFPRLWPPTVNFSPLTMERHHQEFQARQRTRIIENELRKK